MPCVFIECQTVGSPAAHGTQSGRQLAIEVWMQDTAGWQEWPSAQLTGLG